jgi:gamma-glutamylcyclotransferase (GGCT)/AIG2-like uncharacterized protein YtfP
MSLHLFLYGTLLDPKLLARFAGRTVPFTPVTLPGWRRVGLRGGHYPTLLRARSKVEGVFAVVNGPTLARLAAYEGASYRLKPVVVQTTRGHKVARAWIASGGTRCAWPSPSQRRRRADAHPAIYSEDP